MSQDEHKISYEDLMTIIGNAKTNWTKQTLPIFLSKKKVKPYDHSDKLVANGPVHVAMIEAVLMYLNSNGLLNTAVKFDYRDDK